MEYNMSTDNWKVVEDHCVVTVWYCPDCGDYTEVHPDFFEFNGTPVCIDCDTDMAYKHTKVNM